MLTVQISKLSPSVKSQLVQPVKSSPLAVSSTWSVDVVPVNVPKQAFEPWPQAICPPPDWDTKPLPITCTWIVRVVVASGRPDAPLTTPRATRTVVSRTARRPISLAIAETEYAHSGMSVTIVAVLRWKRDGRYRGVGLCLVAIVCAILFGSLGSARAAAVLLVDDDVRENNQGGSASGTG